MGKDKMLTVKEMYAKYVMETYARADLLFVRGAGCKLWDARGKRYLDFSSGISVNHVVTVFYALLGGWIWDRFGPGVLFATAAFMALANSAFALTVPKPVRDTE